MLKALDQRQAGKSHQQVAVALWGTERVGTWHTDRALRGRLVVKGELYMNGWRELLLTGKVRAPARPRKRC